MTIVDKLSSNITIISINDVVYIRIALFNRPKTLYKKGQLLKLTSLICDRIRNVKQYAQNIMHCHLNVC